MADELEILRELHRIACELEEDGFVREADELHDAFIRLAAKRRRRKRLRPWVYTIPFAIGGASMLMGGGEEAKIPTQKTAPAIEKQQEAYPADFTSFKKFTLKNEGGLANRSKKADPGGLTNFGITQGTYDQYMDMIDKPRRSVRKITLDEAKTILRDLYWSKVSAGQLPEKTAVAVADMGVLQGPRKAIQALQKVLALPADGIFGEQTARAVWDYATTPERDADLALKITNLREKQLSNMPHAKYNPGWFNRTDDMRDYIKGPSAYEDAPIASNQFSQDSDDTR